MTLRIKLRLLWLWLRHPRAQTRAWVTALAIRRLERRGYKVTPPPPPDFIKELFDLTPINVPFLSLIGEARLRYFTEPQSGKFTAVTDA